MHKLIIMKKIIVASCLFIVITFLFQNKLYAQTENSGTVLRHIVIITFKQDASADSIKALDELYKTLSKNPMVKDFEMGVNISMRDTGVVKHIYTTSFASKDDMDSYRKVPAYSQLFKVSLPVSAEVNVVDYWVEK